MILDVSELASSPKKRAKTELYIISSSIISTSEKKSLDESYLLQCSETNAAELPATEDIKKKTAEKAEKTTKDTIQSRETEYRPLVNSGFDERLSDKLRPGHIEHSMANVDVGGLRVLNYCQ